MDRTMPLLVLLLITAPLGAGLVFAGDPPTIEQRLAAQRAVELAWVRHDNFVNFPRDDHDDLIEVIDQYRMHVVDATLLTEALPQGAERSGLTLRRNLVLIQGTFATQHADSSRWFDYQDYRLITPKGAKRYLELSGLRRANRSTLVKTLRELDGFYWWKRGYSQHIHYKDAADYFYGLQDRATKLRLLLEGMLAETELRPYFFVLREFFNKKVAWLKRENEYILDTFDQKWHYSRLASRISYTKIKALDRERVVAAELSKIEEHGERIEAIGLSQGVVGVLEGRNGDGNTPVFLSFGGRLTYEGTRKRSFGTVTRSVPDDLISAAVVTEVELEITSPAEATVWKRTYRPAQPTTSYQMQWFSSHPSGTAFTYRTRMTLSTGEVFNKVFTSAD